MQPFIFFDFLLEEVMLACFVFVVMFIDFEFSFVICFYFE